MSVTGKDSARAEVDTATSRVSHFGDYGNLAQALTAMAWGLVAVAEAIAQD